MSPSQILVVWSNYYEELAEKQLASCIKLLEQSEFSYQIEKVAAGTYEIPVVMQYYHRNHPFDGYIPLSLLLQGKTDHYDFIWEHVKQCFVNFALDGLLMGNGIITAPSMDIMIERVEKGERINEAFNTISYLMKFKERIL